MSFARWGLPSLKGASSDKPNRGNTNIRHPWFDDWKGYLGAEHRCLVPFNRFSEPMKLADGKSGNAWFAFGEEAPLSFFAGLRTSWHGTRRKDEGPLDHELFAFFTTTPNVEVAAVHMKAMPVILRTGQEWDVWPRAPWSGAKALQRPLPDGSLDRVAELPLKVLPVLNGEPEAGDPLRLPPQLRPLPARRQLRPHYVCRWLDCGNTEGLVRSLHAFSSVGALLILTRAHFVFRFANVSVSTVLGSGFGLDWRGYHDGRSGDQNS